ncbi:gamma-glutamylcyclotransferase family protein [Dyadobacter sp. OTU695]|uniref:gamma-glutamylcyclotransferase family protein n=1 Tax=Dyadobacter sp. OTU695 TaxID=3043860 RepID=UPI00313B8C3D
MEKLYNLFTYGTLMQGFDNPYARKLRLSSNYIGKGHFNGKLFRVEWYPGALYEPDAPTMVYGEIYHLNAPEILEELDEYEDVLENEEASLYVRKVVPVRNSQEMVIPCWVYLYNKPVSDLPLIEDGCFKTTP